MPLWKKLFWADLFAFIAYWIWIIWLGKQQGDIDTFVNNVALRHPIYKPLGLIIMFLLLPLGYKYYSETVFGPDNDSSKTPLLITTDKGRPLVVLTGKRKTLVLGLLAFLMIVLPIPKIRYPLLGLALIFLVILYLRGKKTNHQG